MAEPRVPFGKATRAAYFDYADAYTPLNHGSYGASPTAVRMYQHQLQTEAEARPDPFIRKTLPRLLDEARAATAPLLGVPVNEVVFVPNATTGVNTVLRNLSYEPGDVVLSFSTAYPAIDKTIDYICETTVAEHVCIVLQYPLEDARILQEFHDAVSAVKASRRRVKIALLDTVITFPGVRMPWEALVEACAESSILSLIDGAHGVGHLDLTHLGKVGPDFFTSNCYNFQPMPKANSNACTLTPVDSEKFSDLFAFVATSDTTPYICVPKALSFRAQLCGGEATIRKYCRDIAQAGGRRVAAILGTETMGNETGTLQDCCFVNVALPLDFHSPTDAPRISKWMMDQAVEMHDTYIPVGYHAGKMWARLSGQIYLEIEDFEFGGRVLEDLCRRVREGEHSSTSNQSEGGRFKL